MGPTKLVNLGHFEDDIIRFWGLIVLIRTAPTDTDNDCGSGCLVRTCTRFAGTA